MPRAALGETWRTVETLRAAAGLPTRWCSAASRAAPLTRVPSTGSSRRPQPGPGCWRRFRDTGSATPHVNHTLDRGAPAHLVQGHASLTTTSRYAFARCRATATRAGHPSCRAIARSNDNSARYRAV
jgi:hypothetical protein